MHRVDRVVHGPPWDFDPAHIPYRILEKKSPTSSPVQLHASDRPRSQLNPSSLQRPGPHRDAATHHSTAALASRTSRLFPSRASGADARPL